jgi:glycosyltransferase involved in cell wall biosynthesis
MKKKRIVLASVLKPVNDTRMFEKIGRSLAESGGFEVFIIGYEGRAKPRPNLHLLPLRGFNRLGAARLFAPLKVLIKVLQLKSDILIVNTHELLIVAIINRIFFGTKIVYDVRENYDRNIRFSEAFPRWLRWPLATWVRLKETLASPLVHHFFVAEKSYLHELPFARKRTTVIENKARLPEGFRRQPHPQKTILLFSGTLAESTGVFEAVQLAKKLHWQHQEIQLHIIGYCSLESTWQRLLREIQGLDFVKLTGGRKLVPHDDIWQAIAAAHFGLICYPQSPHTAGSMPTKFYEYSAAQLPILVPKNSMWAVRLQPYVLPIDFQNPVLPHTHKSERTEESDWRSEAEKLLGVVSGWAEG